MAVSTRILNSVSTSIFGNNAIKLKINVMNSPTICLNLQIENSHIILTFLELLNSSDNSVLLMCTNLITHNLFFIFITYIFSLFAKIDCRVSLKSVCSY